MVEENNPLVSINVITYNSSKFVLETLESAKAQTYQNIELIVSDDCSTDNTVEICREWIEKNKDRFVRTELITVEKNTGIAANCNRAVKASRGEWIKGIAGDDALLPNAIEIYIQFVQSYPDCMIVQANSYVYVDKFDDEHLKGIRDISKHHISLMLQSKYQYKIILWAPSINAPTVFINKKLYDVVGKFDESLWMEDWPMWIKILKHNFTIYFMNDITVKYRIHNDSISNKKDNKIFSDVYLKLHKFKKDYVYVQLSMIDRIFSEVEFYINYFFDSLKLNRNRYINKLIYLGLMKIFVGNYNSIRALFYRLKYSNTKLKS